jgi:hypothetical protein
MWAEENGSDMVDRKMPPGSFIDIDGVLKKKDKGGRTMPCDLFGAKIISKVGKTVRSWNTRPDEVSPNIWWRAYTPAERRLWWEDKLKEKVVKPESVDDDANAVSGSRTASVGSMIFQTLSDGVDNKIGVGTAAIDYNSASKDPSDAHDVNVFKSLSSK